MPLPSLVPRDRAFFDLFNEAGQNTLRAARMLQQMMHRWPDESGLAREILLAEQEGDRITHDVVQLQGPRALLDRDPQARDRGRPALPRRGAALFSTGPDPMVVIRWKDIFTVLERAIDATESAATSSKAS